MGVFLAVRTQKLYNKSDPFFSETTLGHDWERIDLLDYPFMFAVEDLDPRLGSVNVWSIKWTEENGKVMTPMEMVECTLLAPGGQYEDQALASNDYFSYIDPLKSRKPGGFLCPINIEMLGL